jgi:hypothetical protein
MLTLLVLLGIKLSTVAGHLAVQGLELAIATFIPISFIKSSLLLLQVPGISGDYLPTQAATTALKLHERLLKVSYLLIPLFITIGLITAHFSEKFSTKDVISRTILVLALLVTLPFTFGTTMDLGGVISRQIITDSEQEQLRLQIAAEAKEKKQTEEKTSYLNMVGNGILSAVTLNFSDGVISLAHTLYLISGLVISILWRFLVIVAYVLGPVMIAFLLVPSIGERIFMTYLGGVVQLSFWQVWIAICSWFINLTNTNLELILSGNTDKIDASNQLEAAAASLVFALLYLSTPKVVSTLLPIGTINTVGASIVSSSTSLATTALLFSGKLASAKQASAASAPKDSLEGGNAETATT